MTFPKVLLGFQESRLVMVWPSQKQGLYQETVSQAVAGHGSLQVVGKLQVFSGQSMNF